MERLDQLADDLVLAYGSSEEAALGRINEYFDFTWSAADLTATVWRLIYKVRRARGDSAAFQRPEAEELICRLLGFSNWQLLLHWAASGEASPVPALAADNNERSLSFRRCVHKDEWDGLLGQLREQRVSALDGAGLLSDAALRRIAELEHVTELRLGGSRQISDEGLKALSRMPQLERLDLSGGNWSDEGLQVLGQLPNLKSFQMSWQQGVSDSGVAHLRHCHKLESVRLMGSPVGDGVLEALRGKPELRRLETGRLVTDEGLAMLREFPRFVHLDERSLIELDLDGEEIRTQLLVDGPFSNEGMQVLAGLQGVLALDVFWHADGITSEAFSILPRMANLRSFGCDGELSDDLAFGFYGASPKLQKLRAQEAPVSDVGFEALSRSHTLEQFWGRECEGLTGRGFRALARLPKLRNLGVDLQGVDEESLAMLAGFAALRQFTSIGVNDDGFRHVGRCVQLEKLSCMYCRDTGDAATEHIAGLRLKSYYAGLTQITDRSLEILGRMQTLEDIELYETKLVTDAGVAYLAQLANLKKASFFGIPQLTLKGSQVFPAAVQVSYRA